MSRHNDSIKLVGYSPLAKVGPNKRSTDAMVPSRDILIGMSLLAWTYLIIQSFQFAVEGSAANFGPGMATFDWLYQKSLTFGKYGYSVWSVCVTEVTAWGIGEFFRAFLMWQIMIIAMMVPTLLFSANNKTNNNFSSFSKHLAGYLTAWALFSMLMVMLQWMLQISGHLNGSMMINQPVISLGILAITGFAQLRILKQRKFSPPRIIVSKSQYNFGFQSGFKCIQNTWPLMVSMFAFGLMNLVYMFVLTIVMIALFKDTTSYDNEKMVK
ncbi:MAG: DUF2182 domain-containing protein [Lentilitoribacter sp.]